MISDLLKKIKEAVYGEEVRGSIHDAIEQCYKDATGHPDSVAAVVKGLAEETIERKAEADTERKRIDNLTANGTAQTSEIGKTILTTSSSGTSVAMSYLDANVTYDKMFNNVLSKDDDFITIPYPQQGYVAKLLKQGLYHMKFVVRVSRTGGLPEIPMRITLSSSNSLDGDYEAIKTEYLVFPATSSTLLLRNTEFVFAINEPTYIELSVTNMASGSGSFDFSAADCQITAIDWVGKLSGSMPETVDARIGEDGTKYSNLGEAIRTQVKEIERRIDLTGVPRNLLKKSYATNERCGVTTKMNGHDYSITGESTAYSEVIIVAEEVINSNLKPGTMYFAYGYPEEAFIAAKLEDGTTQTIKIGRKHQIELPEGTVYFAFVMRTSADANYDYSGTLYVYDDELDGTLQSQIYNLNEKIDAMQEIITKIVTAPQLIATENGGLQIKYNSDSEEG